MEIEQQKETILELATKWQQGNQWRVACELAKQVMQPAAGDAAAISESEHVDQILKYARQIQEWQGELTILESFVRRLFPSLLQLTPTADLLVDYASVDIAKKCRDLKELEGALRIIKTSPADASNEWIHRRETLNETVEDQMMVLYKKDPRTAAMYSPEIAAILGCSEQSVRKKDNKVWQMFKAEKEANMQRLTRRHIYDNRDAIDDE